MRTPLSWAAILGAWEIGDLLIKRGADVNAMDLDDTTPLHDAANCGHPSMVRRLLLAGADRTIRHSYFGGTAVEIASKCGHTEALRVFQEEIPQ